MNVTPFIVYVFLFHNQSVVLKSPYFIFTCIQNKCCNSSFFCNKFSPSAIGLLFCLCSRHRSCLHKGVFGRRHLFKILIRALLGKWHPTVTTLSICLSVCQLYSYYTRYNSLLREISVKFRVKRSVAKVTSQGSLSSHKFISG